MRISTENRNQTQFVDYIEFAFVSRDRKETKIDRFVRPILEKAGSEIRNARRVGGKEGRERGYCGARWHIVEDA